MKQGTLINRIVMLLLLAAVLVYLGVSAWRSFRDPYTLVLSYAYTSRLVICPGCGDAIREFGLYRWDTSAGGRDQVCKEHDHAMDDIRYFAVTVAAKERGGSWAGSVERRIF